MGLETLHDCHGAFTGNSCGTCFVCHLRAVAREVWRVLRDDGTFWLNLGDSYTSGGRLGHGTRQGYKQQTNRGMNGTNDPPRPPQPAGLAEKNLVGIPWRVALALQQDGWILRSEIIWHKPNVMPESVQDRPTKSHEQVFLFAKQAQYFFDHEAVREHTDRAPDVRLRSSTFKKQGLIGNHHHGAEILSIVGRRARSVWTLPTEPYRGAHFACFPSALVARCIQAGTSERGCCALCQAPYVRQMATVGDARQGWAPGADQYYTQAKGAHGVTSAFPAGNVAHKQTTDWSPSCVCAAGDPVPCTVLDPFGGAGTTALVARQLGRQGVSMDLSWPYLQLARERLGLSALHAWTHGAPAPATRVDDLPLFACGQEESA